MLNSKLTFLTELYFIITFPRWSQNCLFLHEVNTSFFPRWNFFIYDDFYLKFYCVVIHFISLSPLVVPICSCPFCSEKNNFSRKLHHSVPHPVFQVLSTTNQSENYPVALLHSCTLLPYLLINYLSVQWHPFYKRAVWFLSKSFMSKMWRHFRKKQVDCVKWMIFVPSAVGPLREF